VSRNGRRHIFLRAWRKSPRNFVLTLCRPKDSQSNAISRFRRSVVVACVRIWCAVDRWGLGGGRRRGKRHGTRGPRSAARSAASSPRPRPAQTAAATQVFTDRAAFLAALAAGRAENAFDDVAAGAAGGLNYAINGFEYLVYTQFFADGALYNGTGFISTDRVGDQIVVYLSGNPVTAIGGNFWPVDFASRPTDGSIVLEFSDGSQETIDAAGPQDFRGFIFADPIFRLTIDAPDIVSPPPGTSPDRWPALDNLIIGSAQ
jgi:hypothetical protein